jgi:uncharacterized protein
LKKISLPSWTDVFRRARDVAPAVLGGVAGIAAVLLLWDGGDSAPPAPEPPRAEAPQTSYAVVDPAPMPAPEPEPSHSAGPPAIANLTPGQRALAPKLVPAWQRFAAHHGETGGRPLVAVVIDDMGLDRRRSERAIRLPGPLTLSYLTYARHLAEQTAAARAAGHELMVHLPMEPENMTVDPGPNALKVELADEELDRRIAWALSRFPGFVGINNHMGSRFTADRGGMERVMAALSRHGLLWLDSRTTPDTAGPRTARDAGVPFAERAVFLDNETGPTELWARLAELASLAHRTGYAVAIGHPYDATLQALAEWLPTVTDQGLALVPVSAIVRHRLDAPAKAAGKP